MDLLTAIQEEGSSLDWHAVCSDCHQVVEAYIDPQFWNECSHEDWYCDYCDCQVSVYLVALETDNPDDYQLGSSERTSYVRAMLTEQRLHYGGDWGAEWMRRLERYMNECSKPESTSLLEAIQQHADALVWHAICPDCQRVLESDLDPQSWNKESHKGWWCRDCESYPDVQLIAQEDPDEQYVHGQGSYIRADLMTGHLFKSTNNEWTNYWHARIEAASAGSAIPQLDEGTVEEMVVDPLLQLRMRAAQLKERAS